MEQAPDRPRRCSLRLRHHDCAEPGAYFLTICTQDRACIFGEIADGEMVPNAPGSEVLSAWRELPERLSGFELDECVLMPNHFHGIVTLIAAGEPLSQIVSAFKSLSAFRINLKRGTRGVSVWQRGFYDHVVRDERDLARIREYIQNNPARWSLDEENPARFPRRYRRAG